MEGLGPNHTSLLERTGHWFEMTLDWLEMDRTERGQARRMAAIRHGMKHKKQQKPVAPVKEMEGFKPRAWKWIGEDIDSKMLFKNSLYESGEIRAAGFKLPKLKKKEK